MLQLFGMRMLDGHFDWSVSGSAPGPHKEMRIVLSYRVNDKLWPADILAVASSLLTDEDKKWIIPGVESWTIDAEELRRQLPEDLVLPWLRGRFNVRPVVDVTETEVHDAYGVTEYENRIALDLREAPAASKDTGEMPDPRRVYVVHGRNIQARDAMFEFLGALGLQPLEWNQAVALTSSPVPYIGQVLERAFTHVQAIIVLMTPDDEAKLRGSFLKPDDGPYERSLTPQARPNVLFEAGMAMGRYEKRTVLVELGQPLRPFSDIGGRHTVRLDDSAPARQALAQRLKAAECKVDTSGAGWLTAGKFSASVETPPAGVYVYDGDEKLRKLLPDHLENIGVRRVGNDERRFRLSLHDQFASLLPEISAAIVVVNPTPVFGDVLTASTECVYFVGLLQGLLGPDKVIAAMRKNCGLPGPVTVSHLVSVDPERPQQGLDDLDLALKKAGVLPWRD